MTHYDWTQVKKEQLNPALCRQVIHGSHITVARLCLSRGAFVPEHSHVSEQITMLESGRLRFHINGEETIIKGGEALQIPSNAPHSAEALEDSVAVDVFSPIREDWIRGDDAYLRK